MTRLIGFQDKRITIRQADNERCIHYISDIVTPCVYTIEFLLSSTDTLLRKWWIRYYTNNHHKPFHLSNTGDEKNIIILWRGSMGKAQLRYPQKQRFWFWDFGSNNWVQDIIVIHTYFCTCLLSCSLTGHYYWENIFFRSHQAFRSLLPTRVRPIVWSRQLIGRFIGIGRLLEPQITKIPISDRYRIRRLLGPISVDRYGYIKNPNLGKINTSN